MVRSRMSSWHVACVIDSVPEVVVGVTGGVGVVVSGLTSVTSCGKGNRVDGPGAWAVRWASHLHHVWAMVTRHLTRNAGRATLVPLHTNLAQTESQHKIDTSHEVCGVGEDKHNGKRVSILTGSATCAKGDGNKDPSARACDENNGSHPRFTGPVPNCRCNLSWITVPESTLMGWLEDPLVRCPSCKRLSPERVFKYLNREDPIPQPHQLRQGEGLWIRGEFYPDWYKNP